MIIRRLSLRSYNSHRNFSTKLHVNKLINKNQSALRENECTVYLHGLLGNGKNLSTMARKFGGMSSMLLDLRGHGQSPSGSPSHTFEECAKDVLETIREEEPFILSKDLVTSMVGHSFGGRIVLECAHQIWEESLRNPSTNEQRRSDSTYHPSNQFWLLDTVPGEINESVERVLVALHLVDLNNYTHRTQVSQTLQQDHHLDVGLAQWLTSSMTQSSPNSLSWGFDLNVIDALLPEFGSQDFLGKLEHLILSEQRSDSVFYLVRGGKNSGWSKDIISKLDSLAEQSCGRFHVHVLPNAGHWVHVDDLPGLSALWERYRIS